MNTSEFNDIVDKYSDNLYRFVLKSLGNEENAKDIVQESFSRLWVKRDNIETEKAKSYLFTTAYHLIVDFSRKKKKEKALDEKDTNNFFSNNTYSDLSDILEKALNRLPEQYKELILLRDYEGYSYKEIEKITELNESQVKVYIFRARKIMKEFIVKPENVI
jgi:RNA polymerase sigma-70 factor (ECF subfamily)